MTPNLRVFIWKCICGTALLQIGRLLPRIVRHLPMKQKASLQTALGLYIHKWQKNYGTWFTDLLECHLYLPELRWCFFELCLLWECGVVMETFSTSARNFWNTYILCCIHMHMTVGCLISNGHQKYVCTFGEIIFQLEMLPILMLGNWHNNCYFQVTETISLPIVCTSTRCTCLNYVYNQWSSNEENPQPILRVHR